MLDKGVERLGFDVITPVNPFTDALKSVSCADFIFDFKACELAAFTEFILFVYLKRKAAENLSKKRLMPRSAQSFD